MFDQLGFSPEESRKAQLKVKLLGSILDIYRSKGYTQAEVAALWNKPPSRVSEILTGKLHLVRIGTLIDLLESLGDLGVGHLRQLIDTSSTPQNMTTKDLGLSLA
ncbi:MAG: XRE family transcriptional regulator [Proteobacteria bacterium]|nr:XRE family transcriptional regulator [Pseudomonadota bacterium]